MQTMMKSWLVWSIFSALFAGLTAVLAKMGVEGVNSNLATAIRTTVVLVFTWAIAAQAASPAAFAGISKRSWLFLFISGLATGLSWICYFRALQLGKASQVAPIDKLSVVFAITLAAFFLRESITWHHWVGGGLIVAGSIVLTLR
jgi:bacterial/archaeal transporter family protein